MNKQPEQNDYEEEILRLRAEVFQLRTEIQSLRGSRVVGRIIKARDMLVPLAGKTLRAPKYLLGRAVYFSKEAVIAVLPHEKTEQIKKKKRELKTKIKETLRQRDQVRVEVLVEDREKVSDGPLLSVVIPYFNRADTIDETMASLTKQTFKRFEVIVVDDGSTDEKSIKSVKTVADRYKDLDITVLYQKNSGVASARNSGIARAKAEYVLCLDSDDLLEETYIEKALLILESTPSVSLVTTYREDFGVQSGIHVTADYDPLKLYKDNMVTTAAVFKKQAWEETSGYKSGIGYEDWEFWLTLAERGFWGKTIREPLFRYRVAMQSRFVDDRSLHWDTIKTITSMHKGYKQKIKGLQNTNSSVTVRTPENAFMHLSNPNDYLVQHDDKPKVLIAIPWMIFGGAETLLYNYTSELKDDVDITFMTGVAADHEWEYKFRRISNKIYHLPELFADPAQYLEFISSYIETRQIDILHIVHSGFVFDMLPELKKRHPGLKVLVTMFNDRVPEYVQKTIEQKQFIDHLNTDSQAVAKSFDEKLGGTVPVKAIPNGIDCYETFNPKLFDRKAIRKELKLDDDTCAVFFVGRLSPEKNPDVFIEVAHRALEEKLKKVHFFILGDGPMRKDIEHLIMKYRLENMTFIGYKEDVPRYLAAADVFILPSSIEGFPLSILEAMAMDVAVISSKVGAVPDVIKNGVNGYTVEVGDVSEIYKRLKELQITSQRTKIQKKAKEEVQSKFSTIQLGESYRKIYREAAR